MRLNSTVGFLCRACEAFGSRLALSAWTGFALLFGSLFLAGRKQCTDCPGTAHPSASRFFTGLGFGLDLSGARGFGGVRGEGGGGHVLLC